MASEKPKSERLILLALLLFLGAGVLVFSSLGPEEHKSQSMTGNILALKTEKFEKSVNKHLMHTNERMKLEKQKTYLENVRLLNNDLNSMPAQHRYVNDDKLDLSSDNRAAEIAEELGRGVHKEQANGPDDIVQKDLFNEQQMQEYSQAYREEYARQFIENARRGGYKVILSSDLTRVISVIPLRKPSQNENLQLMPGTSGVQ